MNGRVSFERLGIEEVVRMLATIGYEKSTPEDFLSTLQNSEIEVLVDIRDRAQSRRRGFSKTALMDAAREVGIEYVHVKALGDPKEGRDAARAGLMKKFEQIFGEVMKSPPAKQALDDLARMATEKRICLMCYERDHRICHRKIVSKYLEDEYGLKAMHIGVIRNHAGKTER